MCITKGTVKSFRTASFALRRFQSKIADKDVEGRTWRAVEGGDERDGDRDDDDANDDDVEEWGKLRDRLA